MKKTHLLFVFLQIIFINSLFSQTYHRWEGGFSSSWHEASNWFPKEVPGSKDWVGIHADRPNYPILTSDISVARFEMHPDSRIDFNGHQLNITVDSWKNPFSTNAATMNNSAPGTDIVINLKGEGINVTWFRGTTVNDNITFNVAMTGKFNTGDIFESSANTFEGNVTINTTEFLEISVSNGGPTQFKGDLTINRTKGGDSRLFYGGAQIKGNFKFTNDIDGFFRMGRGIVNFPTTIDGKVDISIKNITPAPFEIYGIENKTTGGVIETQNTQKFDIRESKLKVKSISISGYHGNEYSHLENNDITGNITIANDANYKSTYLHSNIKSNKITGNTQFILNNGNIFWEGRQKADGNHYIGNVNYSVTGATSLFIGDGGVSTYDGNLTINRTGTGPTKLFNAGAIINGNFSFTNNAAGDVTIGNTSVPTNISGKVDIAINDTLPSGFELFRIINNTSGGNIHVQNSKGFDIRNDTLKLTTLKIIAYKGDKSNLFSNNDITGNITLEDDLNHSKSLSTRIESNKITGNTNIIINSDQTFHEANAQRSGNHFGGDITYTVNSKANLNISNRDPSVYDGNLTINRIGSGLTQAFDAGATIGGNFSFTKNTSGDALFGNLTKSTTIGGKIDIVINDTLPSKFNMFSVSNQTSGGTIDVQNTRGFRVQNDTLKVNTLRINGYRTGDASLLYNNDITGNVIITNDELYNISTNLNFNKITGNTTFTNNSSQRFNDAPFINTGNYYVGNVTFNNNSSGTITIGSADTTSFGGDVILNGKGISLYRIKFVGNSNGIIQQTGTKGFVKQKAEDNPIININTMVMDKGANAKIILKNPIAVSNLNLVSGRIETGENSHIEFSNYSTSNGGSDASFVNGAMVKTGNQAFTFPIGHNNKYAPLTISAPAKATDQFRAQYIAEGPHNAGYDSTKKDASLNHISRAEYWLLERVTGTSDVSVTIGWDEKRNGGVSDISSLRVAHWNGTKWEDLGKGTTSGTSASGTIQTAAAVSNFSPFTLASTTALNALPIKISRFDAVKNLSSVSLNWTTENEINFSHFEVERAGRDNQFSRIGKVSAHNGFSMKYYRFEDHQPLNGVNLYRLKLIDLDGKFMYSAIVSVSLNDKSAINIYPNPASDFIQIDGLEVGVTIEINDASGRLVRRILSNASNRYSLSDLRKGMYFIKIIGIENTTVSKLIIQ